ncbi:hypothetical protein FGM00_04335 [Aggregatimonas sangjinii]|uniref:Adhesin domain-containing protein n=1 Tax=Aggregatimonas sangjinii TaxID=2583587 RepID=A0A5B7SLE7_9FLAO|nr:hypothetical protein [Aggregatimonas sangjinii]QCW99375.1 hypothetical protein FGM00_04335 [Aggregatimonas sangjinii]
MIRILLFKIATVLFLVAPITLFAHNGKPKGKYTKEKTIKKEFNVNADALLKVDNSYGNLNITSWTENRVLIEVHIKTNGNNEEKVQRKLDEITVNFDNSASMVSAKTIFDNNRSSWGWGNNTKVNMQINYTIKVPVKNNVHLNNDYGSIILDRIDGHAKINCDYGRLDIGELRGRNNQLNFDYTSKSRIGYMNSGKISADYSDFTIEKAGDLTINADYTNSAVEKMGNLVYSSDYGKIEIGEAGNVQGNGDYINVNLGTLHGNVDINADYGSVRIDQMAADAGNLLIKSDYTGIKVGYDSEYHFSFEIRTSYAGVSGKDEFEMNISEVKNTSKYYKGHYGSANTGNSVSISSDYGGVSFHKN